MRLRLLALSVSLLLALPAHAAKSPLRVPAQLGVEAPAPSVTTAAGRFDAQSGQPLAIYRPDYTARPASIESMAREYLQARAPGAQLRTRAVRDLGAFGVARFEQVFEGLPVYASEVVVSVAPDGRVLQVQQRLEDIGTTPVAPARIDADEALRAASAWLGAGPDFHFLESTEMWWVREGARRVWRLRLEPKGYPNGSFEVLVDALSGEVLRVEDVELRFDGNGRVFDPDPLSSSQSTYGNPGYTDGNDANTPQLEAQLANVPLRDLTQAGVNWTLVGPWASCVDWDAPTGANNCPTSANGSFLYTRDNDNFESVNVYHHIDTFMRYINVTLGIALTPRQYQGGVQYDPRGFNGADNSSFSSGTGRLRFGEGGVDDAEDADVVIHELGHGVHDWITNGGLSQTQGLSEGVGDYLAASYSRSYNDWPTNAAPYFWMFDWDGHNEFWAGRVTNYHLSVSYPNIGSLHTAGQYWASCNLLNYNSIGRERSDRAFLLGLAMTGSSSNQQDAAQAVLNAAAAAGYTPAEVQAMYDNYTAGTTVPANRRCNYVLTLPPTGWTGFANGFE